MYGDLPFLLLVVALAFLPHHHLRTSELISSIIQHSQGVDWWTLGILIFETLVGQPPFNDDDPMGIYQQVGRLDSKASKPCIGPSLSMQAHTYVCSSEKRFTSQPHTG